MKISDSDLQRLKSAIFYMHVEELKDVCETLSLPLNGKKIDLIHRIIIFLERGKIVKTALVPEASRAKVIKPAILKPDTLILFGSYKNDLRTRLFLKKMIGKHFHFTAFGQDWMRERWMAEDPPTYAEFADYWQEEYTRRQKKKAQPKQEWAYINFLQRYYQKKPQASRQEMTDAWEKKRSEEAQKVYAILKKIKP